MSSSGSGADTGRRVVMEKGEGTRSKQVSHADTQLPACNFYDLNFAVVSVGLRCNRSRHVSSSRSRLYLSTLMYSPMMSERVKPLADAALRALVRSVES